MTELDRGDINPVIFAKISSLSPDFSGKIIEGLSGGIAKRARVLREDVIPTLERTARFIQSFIDGVISDPGCLSDTEVLRHCQALGVLNRDEKALATSYFVMGVLGREESLQSNIYRYTKEVERKTLERGDNLFLGNIGRQRFGTNSGRLVEMTPVAVYLSQGPSSKSPYKTAKVVYEYRNMEREDGVIKRVRERKFEYGGRITPELWAAMGNEVERVLQEGILVQNYLHTNPLLGRQARSFIKAYNAWLVRT